MRLLVVEDDIGLARSLKEALGGAGFAVDLAEDGIEAEFLGDQEPYDAVILDLGLPKRPGLEVLKHWREHGNTVPVIVLTARDAWHEKVDGFKAGADDYLGKPFHIAELIARIQAVLRRRHGQAGGFLKAQGLTLDEERQIVILENGTMAQLTAIEFRLLRYFMLHHGRILYKTRLSEHIYDYEAERDSNVIEVYVNRLRGKLGRDLIRTHRGQGYVFGSLA